MDELVAAADRAESSGLMSETDKRIVLEHMERLYRELFAQYDEFKEGDVMLRDRILTYSEEAELKGKAEGRAEGKFEVARNFLAMGLTLEQVAEGTGLPQNELQALLPLSGKSIRSRV
jgi:predicted transposase/invertase (TIGR01784 family)